MENASKVLIMAGTILISIMVVSLGAYIINMFGEFTQRQEQERINQQIAEFNAGFLKYEGRTDITAQDIVTVANLAKENNEYYELTKADASSNPEQQGSYYVSVIINKSFTPPISNLKKSDGSFCNIKDFEECVNKEEFLKYNNANIPEARYTCESVIVSDITKSVVQIVFK